MVIIGFFIKDKTQIRITEKLELNKQIELVAMEYSMMVEVLLLVEEIQV